MLRLNLVIVKIFLGLILGFFVHTFYPASFNTSLRITTIAFLSLVLLHLLAMRYKWLPTSFGVLLFIQGVALGMLLSSFHSPKAKPYHYSLELPIGKQLYIVMIREVLKPNSWSTRYIADLAAINKQRIEGGVLLTISRKNGTTKFHAGDFAAIHSDLKALPKTRQPYQFDYAAYLKTKHVYAQFTVDCEEVRGLTKESSHIFYTLSRFRESLKRQLQTYSFSAQQRQTLEALILGDRTGISDDMRKAYVEAGMIHILAVSGLHVGIVLWLLRRLTSFIHAYRWRYWRSGIIIACIWAFALFTGGSASVLRAATMFSFLEIGRNVGGQNQTANALLYSAFLLVLIDPLLLHQVGFQLSYLAVTGILWIQPWLSALFRSRYRVLRFIWNTLSVTLAAQIAVLPLSLYYFHQFPGLFLLSNLVVLPCLSIVLVLGILVVFLGAVDMLPSVVVKIIGSIIEAMNQFIAWVARQDDFVWRNIRLSIWVMLASYLSIYALILCFKKYSYQRLLLCLLVSLLLCSLLFLEHIHIPRSHLAIVNKARSTRLIAYSHKTLQLYHNHWVDTLKTETVVSNYLSAVPIERLDQDSLQAVYSINNKKLLIVDSLAVYDIEGLVPDVILLTQSPKLNLERLLTKYPKVTIVADGSNYKSYVARWKKTCISREINFHSTYEQGAYIMK
ncbi:MAG: hypothetical protein CL867_10460 [Cytophagaceae bacterium]|nr:hypothetical protein [Cytophagaceae bacterium]